ncbi:MAG: FtsX-like permease family protein [Bacteroidia bacterium]|nr:MAG: FtsX-like permease family protein [Bacteroidia bacterium]
MARQEDKIIGRRLRSSYVSTVVSITLVLFVLGLLGLIILHAHKLSEYVRESIAVSVFLEEGASNAQINGFKSSLREMPAVHETRYISSEEAAEDLMKELGEDFIEFLGYNPLSASIVIHLRAAYTHPDSLRRIEQQLLRSPIVNEVDYQQSLVHLVHENVRRVGAGLLIFSLLLLIIAFALINNTIRLSVFSRRFLIKSMQLVGATQGFIRMPFIIKGVVQGIVGAVVAIILLGASLYFLQQQIPELSSFYNRGMLLVLFATVLLLGVIISWVSTFFAVRKYLKIKTDFLYLY